MAQRMDDPMGDPQGNAVAGDSSTDGSKTRSTIRWRLIHLFALGFRAALIVTLSEALKLVVRVQPPFLSAFETLSFLVHVLCLAASLALIVVAAESFVCVGLVFRGARGARIVRDGLGPQDELGPKGAQGLGRSVVALVAAVAMVGLIYGVLFARRRASIDLPELVDHTLAWGAGALCLLVLPGVFRASEWLDRSLGRAVRLSKPLQAATMLLAVVGLEVLLDTKFPMLALETNLYAATAIVLLVAQWSSRGLGSTHAIEAVFLIVAACFGPVLAGTSSPRTREIIRQRSDVAGSLLEGALTPFDLDGDGFYPPWVGGYDCDDADPNRNPFAHEVPNNGIDEDCSGRDATLVAADDETVSGGPPAREAGRTLQPDILLVTIDTLSAGHTTLGGYMRDTTPNLAQAAKMGTVFETAYSPCPATACAMPALSQNRFGSRVRQTAVGGVRTIGREMTSLGYRTVAVFSMQPPSGFEETMTLGIPSKASALAPAQIDQMLLAFAKADERPTLVWLHIMDPHAEYVRRTDWVYGTTAMDRYDGEIRATDQELGRGLAALFAAPRARPLALIVTADHGEEFFRFKAGHGLTLSEAVLNVPFLIVGPGIRPQRIAQPVNILRVLPTLLDLGGASGRRVVESLIPLASGERVASSADNASALGRTGDLRDTGGLGDPSAAAFAELYYPLHQQWAIREARYKLVLDLRFGYRQLFDMVRDPLETTNLADDLPDEAKRLEERLWAWRDEISAKE